MKKGVILLTFVGLFDKDRGKEIPLYCERVREDIRTAVCADEDHSHYLHLCIPDHGPNVLKRLGNRNLLK